MVGKNESVRQRPKGTAFRLAPYTKVVAIATIGALQGPHACGRHRKSGTLQSPGNISPLQHQLVYGEKGNPVCVNSPACDFDRSLYRARCKDLLAA